MTYRISVVQPYDLAFALNLERDLIVRSRYYPTLRVEYLNREMSDVPAIGRYGFPVHGESNSRRFSYGRDLKLGDHLPVLGAHGFERARLIGHRPCQVQIRRGARGLVPPPELPILHAREPIALHPEGLAVHK